MIAIYARVSTEGQTIEPQLIELRRTATDRGWKISHELSDVISGGTTSRPGLDQLMALVRARKIHTVMVVKLDRLARSLSGFCQMVDEFKRFGVALVIPGQGIDTSKSNPCGEMQMAILAAVAQFEKSLISERTKAGLAVAKARGVQLGHHSPTMVRGTTERIRIIAGWLYEQRPAGFRGLGERLGGVSAGTAWKIYQQLSDKLSKNPAPPVPEMMEVEL